MKLKKTVMCAVMTALIFAATCISVPTAFGYANLGDAFILISVWMLGLGPGAVSAVLGSVLADVIIGFAFYAPATAIIKGLSAVIFYFAVKEFSSGKNKVLPRVFSAVSAECTMVLGYYLFNSFWQNNFVSPLLSVTSDIIQAVIAVILFVAMSSAIIKIKGSKS